MRVVKLGTAVGGLVVASSVSLLGATGPPAAADTYGTQHLAINCARSSADCAEVADSEQTFGYYVGHDEPGIHFYSNTPGSGNRLQTTMVLPTDPSFAHPNTPGKSYTQELNATAWFGMTLCDTQSYPEQVGWCHDDSDSNIVDLSVSPKHPGAAFLELQIYPPGWIQWPTWAVAVGVGGCNPTKWCAALNVDSLLENPVTGQLQNPTCRNLIGVEPINFAFLTLNGKSTGPANPVDATIGGTFTPDLSRDLFMNSGDTLKVTIQDTSKGVQTIINDVTTGQTGSMTASHNNGFAQIKFDPTGTSCTPIPYDFHPMYSTATTKTITPWAADQDNISITNEIGHFQYCNGPTAIPTSEFGINSKGVISCPATDSEEIGVNAEPSDGDDNFCFPGTEAPALHLNGCQDTNTGFDGVGYTPVWPDGNTKLHPTPWQWASPLTGASFDTPYSQAGFEVDLGATEFATGQCDRLTGAGCSQIPQTDDGQPAQFYPFFSINTNGPTCLWQFGNDIPGSPQDFGRNAQYGPLYGENRIQFGGGGKTVTQYEDFRNILPNNPC